MLHEKISKAQKVSVQFLLPLRWEIVMRGLKTAAHLLQNDGDIPLAKAHALLLLLLPMEVSLS